MLSVHNLRQHFRLLVIRSRELGMLDLDKCTTFGAATSRPISLRLQHVNPAAITPGTAIQTARARILAVRLERYIQRNPPPPPPPILASVTAATAPAPRPCRSVAHVGRARRALTRIAAPHRTTRRRYATW